jgi:hypothetical protein
MLMSLRKAGHADGGHPLRRTSTGAFNKMNVPARRMEVPSDFEW